ncbi:MAG: hypothetical protein M0T76_04570 [Desulfobacteraceae bacterium]|nr:hypothetical protein [Desulfobacteraceae bacterium]
MKLKVMTTCAFMFPGLLFCTQAFAMDNLFLCGLVKDVDVQKALVSVDITSGSCPGLRQFQLAEPQSASRFIVGEEKCFPIDSSHCNDNIVHKILIRE